MDARHGKFQITPNNDLSEINRMAQALESFGRSCALSEKTLSELNLILEEIVTNIISYAYDDDKPHQIGVSAVSDGVELSIEVEDDGRPFDPLQVDLPCNQSLEEMRIGGVGLRLIRGLTSSITYDRKEGKNRLAMTKRTG